VSGRERRAYGDIVDASLARLKAIATDR